MDGILFEAAAAWLDVLVLLDELDLELLFEGEFVDLELVDLVEEELLLELELLLLLGELLVLFLLDSFTLVLLDSSVL